MAVLNVPNELIDRRFPMFGPNKRQEIVRLVFEISKRDRIGADAVLEGVPSGCRSYAAVKDHLLRHRFPDAVSRGQKVLDPFPALDIDPAHAMPLSRRERVPAPQRVYIEDGLEKFALVRRLEEKLPGARFIPIGSYKDHCAGAFFDVKAYNRRTEELFIVLEKYDYFKPCPCSGGAVPCGYHNANLGLGCPFECTYCFLQNYTNTPGIVLPANLEDFFEAFAMYPQDVRLGSGQTTDSLVYDDLTGFSASIVDFFRSRPRATFEFKTKSDNVQGLLGVRASSNIVVGWSVNPPSVIGREEHFTATLDERLKAAGRCAAHGYRTAFHFDPVIHAPGWEEAYAKVVAAIFLAVPPESIAWISVGTLRMTLAQKKTIENRFPENTILDAELLMAEDGKLRYAHQVRLDIYRKMMSWIREKAHASTRVYLCMETASIWEQSGAGPDANF